MLGNNRGQDYDVLQDGEAVLRVRYLWPQEPSECCMCDQPTHSTLAVPYYCGPVRDGQSEGCHAVACSACYQRWTDWSSVKLCNCGHWDHPGVIHGMRACYIARALGDAQDETGETETTEKAK